MANPIQTTERQKRGDPAGTRFAVITMMVLLVLVGIYFLVVQGREVAKQPEAATPGVVVEQPPVPAGQ